MNKQQKPSFEKQLQKFRPFVKKAKPFRFELPATDSIGVDGLDHINVWYRGETDLGKALDQLADTPFIHPVYGNFGSIEGFWHWLRSATRDDRVRHMSGMKARNFGAKLRTQWVKDFRCEMMKATWLKIKQYPPLENAIKDSTLPFDLYTFHESASENETVAKTFIRTRPISAFWIIRSLEEMRSALKEGREVNFEFLIEPDSQEKTKYPSTAQERRSALTNPLLHGRVIEGKKSQIKQTMKDKQSVKPVAPEDLERRYETEQCAVGENEENNALRFPRGQHPAATRLDDSPYQPSLDDTQA
jgi:hypothetical protein